MRTIVIGNWKGGVGKTTVATNLACAFANNFPELHVLFIDCDKQGNSSARFCADFSKPNLTNILVDGVAADEAIQQTQYCNIDLIAADPSLMAANFSILKEEERRQDNILELALEPVKDKYDLCFIDTPPDFNISVLNCLNICDDLIGITTLTSDSVEGLRQLRQNVIEMYNDVLGRDLQLRGVLVNMYRPNEESSNYIDELKKDGFIVFDSYLYSARTTAEQLQLATNKHMSIFEVAPRCAFARCINNFLIELIGGDK
ncbi:hypothetical protein NZ47_02800 [Anaerovibrio lipolyticus]|uniref:AAA domain-containing protein n=1 Tax=Anaerovibrio lipolyticus TaxID=82374 RepID=A0A0B2K1M8_9FIRM|nr:ParA family protein [Anaerovibrio lipolyticus]KHM52783.1 hypothetical protein NZ47_02800 [Anaerovibrio lipolyticus]